MGFALSFSPFSFHPFFEVTYQPVLENLDLRLGEFLDCPCVVFQCPTRLVNASIADAALVLSSPVSALAFPLPSSLSVKALDDSPDNLFNSFLSSLSLLPLRSAWTLPFCFLPPESNQPRQHAGAALATVPEPIAAMASAGIPVWSKVARQKRPGTQSEELSGPIIA
jgi:hypothetical protein